MFMFFHGGKRIKKHFCIFNFFFNIASAPSVAYQISK